MTKVLNFFALTTQSDRHISDTVPVAKTGLTNRKQSEKAIGFLVKSFTENNNVSSASGIKTALPGSTDNKSGWEIVGEWKQVNKKYSAEVIAKQDTSAKDLAKLITGNEEDYKLLNLPNEKVVKGTKVDVSPLLQKMETQLRENVLKNQQVFNSKFPNPSNTLQITESIGTNVKDEQVKVLESGKITITEQGLIMSEPVTEKAVDMKKPVSESVNDYFCKQDICTKEEKEKPYSFRDCNFAIQTIYTKSILDMVGDKTFNDLGYQIGQTPIQTQRVKNINEVKNGDWIAFDNYPDYTSRMKKLGQEGAWQAENVIKIGNDRYWGHGANDIDGKSEVEWKTELKNAYNMQFGTTKKSPLPGFNGNVSFIDVSKVATDLFNLRVAQIK
jgi:Protein-glutamine gamma-glutamyltransferase